MESFWDLSDGNVKSGGENWLSAVVPLMKLLSLAVIGLILAHPKLQVMSKATFRLLSKLVFVLFLPCLIFTHLGQSITGKNFVLWWFIPVNVIISTAVGCILGYLVAIICQPPPEFFRFTIIMTAFGNTGNLPLAIVGSVCHSAKNPFGPDCHTSGVSYVSFAQWVAVILVYTLVYHMMEPPLEYYEIVEEGNEIEEVVTANDLSRPLLVEAEWPGMEDKETEHCKTPFIARVFTRISSISPSTFPDVGSVEEGGPNSPKSIRCLVEPKVVRRIRIVAEQTPIQHILQPLQLLLYSLSILAGAAIPFVLLILGGMLAEGPHESKLGIRTVIGISVARLLVLPLIGIGIILLADKMNFLVPGDKMYRFVLLLQYTTPSAILLGAIASLRGYAVSEASALLFWQHVFAVFSLSLYIIIYYKVLLPYV
ncbi:Protein PIN-likeS 2 [Vitis vinifera]|uniref:Protein PIN-likeS 2 n=1 Tax=Vitis vinifera TaxID=29760 RepID=A0A438HGC4_VITVI|nr:Protein PIN-likeS 2 [Vitis vinifera]